MSDSRPDPLRALLAPVRTAVLQGSILSLASALVWPIQAALVAAALAALLAEGEPSPGLAPWPAALGLLALFVLRALLSHMAEARLFDAADRVVADRRAAIVTREARTLRGDGAGPGAIATLAGEKLETLGPYVQRYYPAMARSAVVPVVILALAFWHAWAVGTVLLLAGPLIPLFMALIGWAAHEASARHLAGLASMTDLLVDRLAALVDIRLLDAGARVTADYAASAEDLRARTMRVLRIAFLSSTVLELFAALGVAMVAVWVGFSLLGLIAWGGSIDARTGIFLLLLAPDYFQPLRDLSAAWHDRAAARALADELADWQARTPALILGTGALAAPLPGAPEIRLSGVTLGAVTIPDAVIAPGARVGVTGPSGAGKSTLLRALAGLERPDLGTIAVCGRPLDDASADAWRARLGWMPQAPLFPQAPLRTIIAGRGALDPDLLAMAALGPVLARLPQGLDTVPGETGAGLSGGEARRVMLARMLHARPAVVLADEPTADLDPETARQVSAALMRLAAGGTTLIVASHDPDLIARMDQRIALEARP
ncbi:MAG: ATP-binding cassette domain-containing protein [Rhodobacter sp.]|uniref:ABC transporter ATP-binding protein/permease n=1 Tax=Pararhodobacter sp. TaxID=2127056 RepID=UPI001DDC0E8B|nr:ATP-binding cassette domain-containing protein [Pararhodobacter sp.]MCB1346198.1 ATP-binding cassette domain-containing protein [Paracoccaceae bacterium]MCC0071665.1 ATP-binding cassette domain-containing protein [Rhodobacter sp.]HPD93481.1 ATP-binding cassette domain-containing protein [Pararhodobacter sp.]